MTKIVQAHPATRCNFCNRGGVALVGWQTEAMLKKEAEVVYCCPHCAANVLPKLVAAAGLPLEDLAERGEQAYRDLADRTSRAFAYAAGITAARAVKELADDPREDPACA